MRVAIDDPARDDVRALLEEHLRHMRATSPPESVHALDLARLKAPDITFWSVRDGDGTLLGCGALKQLDAAHGEVKSMRTPDAQRRRGAGRAVLERIVGEARARGYRRLSLETGSMDAFVPARRLYESVGFGYCGPFADYRPDPNSVFMTLPLPPPPAMFIAAPAASDAVDRVYASSVSSQGFVMNLMHAWAWRPDVFEGFAALRTQLTAHATLTPRDLAVLVSAAASAMGDAYCSLAWGSKLAQAAGPTAAASVLQGADDDAELTPRDRLLARWARQVARGPTTTTHDDVDALRRGGLSEREIVEATMFIAFRLAFSTVNAALGVLPDRALADAAPAPVREAVCFGRPVAASPSPP